VVFRKNVLNQSGRLPALDGVRAIAVLAVIANHSGISRLGGIGVDIFFGLSGYLISGILLDAKVSASSPRAYLIPFYMRRALRILPLAWTVAVIMVLVRGEWSGLLWYMGFLVNWLPQAPPPRDLGHYWSLAVEEQFYLVWPVLVLFASSTGLRRCSIAVIGIAIVWRFAISMWPPSFATEQFQDFATFARADTLAVGALLAQRERNGGFGREVFWALPVALMTGAALIGLLVLEKGESLPWLLTFNVRRPLITLGVGAGLLFVLTRPPRALQWSWLVWIGKISYGIYVIHGCFGYWLHSRFSLPPLIFFFQLGLTIPLAAASWYLFESPILKQKRRWPMPSRKPIPTFYLEFR